MSETLNHTESASPHFEDVVRERMDRRGALKALFVVGGTAAGVAAAGGAQAQTTTYATGELTFDALPLNTTDGIGLSQGFKHDVVISWGDPVVRNAPAFDVNNQTPAAQATQFGFNNDYVDYRPLPFGSNNSRRGLLWVNHEYTSANMMFPGVTYSGFNSIAATTPDQKRVEIEAHGASIVKVRLRKGTWAYDRRSKYNRRITGSTPIALSGPVAGYSRVKTNADPTGTLVKGMFNNCGGGHTPWGTILTAEENFDQYFANRGALATAAAAETDPVLKEAKTYAANNASVFGIPSAASSRGWELVEDRFDMLKDWNEPFRFGWIVEVDPYDPQSTPKKRTALGRFKHEAAAGTIAPNGQYAVYMGDDQAGQFIYKFVTAGTVQKCRPEYDYGRDDDGDDDRDGNDDGRRAANRDLLDSGTLYVARFDADGTGTWLPLVFGSVPALSAPAFADQADLLIRTRTAAAALGATPMDRPEDVEVNPATGKIYAAMTGTSRSTANAANPRLSNTATDPNSSRGGHIIEITETGGNHAGATFSWEIFMLCGAPGVGGTLDATTVPAAANSSGRTYFAGFDETQVSPITRPDNVAFDSAGNLWISTDGQPSAASGGGLAKNDMFYGVPTQGAERGHLKALCSVPLGAEATGPYFTPDDKTLFGAVQHPGEDGNNLVPQSTWNAITTTAPGTGAPVTIARNGVIAIRRNDGSSIPFGKVISTASSSGVPTGSKGVVAAAGLVAGAVVFRKQRMDAKLDAADE